ncbi:MAG: TIGR04149 family rSAM-modified RiPP [Dysgonamonadaceae bacterium]|nr:TIGR04149 family rSAM-modified RiPP [Dysgonamonadaceae bacterium]
MKKVLKKIRFRNVSENFSDSEMKHIIGGGYIGTGYGSSCYSSSGSCHSSCAFIDTLGNPHSGTCTDVGSNICACVS